MRRSRPPVRRLALWLALGVLAACEAPAPGVRPAPPRVVVPPAAASPPAAPLDAEEPFRGSYRALAKTSYAMQAGALAPVEAFADLTALRAYLAPNTDPRMRARYPHLARATGAAGERLPEEWHNVSVVAYLHAVKHEDGPRGDNDYHVMLGSSPVSGDGIFLTAEASALPETGEGRAPLAVARAELIALLGTCRCDGRFRKVDPPIHVRVTGSLFFDGDHGIGAVGPAYAKPFTVWEIHPILSIERIDAGAEGAATGDAARPSTAPPPADPPAWTCRDGTLSRAHERQNACRRHGGVVD